MDLNILVDEISKLLENPKMQDVEEEVIDDLRLNALHLSTYQTRLVEPMTESATNMVKVAKELEEKLKFNHDSFEEAIKAMILEVEQAEQQLKDTGTDDLLRVSSGFGLYFQFTLSDMNIILVLFRLNIFFS